jgi:hypothetical protein
MNDVSNLLERIRQGEPAAAEELLPLLYDELRKLAAVRLANEPFGNTLDATALVHEAFTFGSWRALNVSGWPNRAETIAATSSRALPPPCGGS